MLWEFPKRLTPRELCQSKIGIHFSEWLRAKQKPKSYNSFPSDSEAWALYKSIPQRGRRRYRVLRDLRSKRPKAFSFYDELQWHNRSLSEVHSGNDVTEGRFNPHFTEMGPKNTPSDTIGIQDVSEPMVRRTQTPMGQWTAGEVVPTHTPISGQFLKKEYTDKTISHALEYAWATVRQSIPGVWCVFCHQMWECDNGWYWKHFPESAARHWCSHKRYGYMPEPHLREAAEKRFLWEDLVRLNESDFLTESGKQLLTSMKPPLSVMEQVLGASHHLVVEERNAIARRTAELMALQAQAPPVGEEVIPREDRHLCVRCRKMKANYVRLGRPIDRFKEPCGH
jgi:hypothetical protein